MLILFSVALFGFGLLLFCLGIAVWLIGLAIRIAIRLFQLGLLIIMGCTAVRHWLQQRRKVDVLEGEILPPERRALPDRSRVRRLLFAGTLVLVALSGSAWAIQENSTQGPSTAYVDQTDGQHVKCIRRAKELNGLCQQYEIADDWRQRAKAAVPAPAPEPGHQPCVLYADQQDGRLRVRAPICFTNNGDVYSGSFDGYLTFSDRKAGATHPAVKCTGIVENVERVDPTTFLVRRVDS
jgi:hypothetical protein